MTNTKLLCLLIITIWRVLIIVLLFAIKIMGTGGQYIFVGNPSFVFPSLVIMFSNWAVYRTAKRHANQREPPLAKTYSPGRSAQFFFFFVST